MTPRPWINFAFLIQEERIDYLKQVLDELLLWDVDDLKVVVSVNRIPGGDFGLFELNDWVSLRVVDIENQDPRILQWDHKKQMPEFLTSDYTHFIYADADLLLKYQVVDYFIEFRDLFHHAEFGFDRFIPGTFRYEHYEGTDRCLDFTYRTDMDTIRFVEIDGRTFFSPQEPFQGISIMDRYMVAEHLNSKYIHLDSIGVYGFGHGETAISGYIFDRPPYGFPHRVLLPVEIDPRCWIKHLPANYAANPNKEHGKINAQDFFRRIKEEMKRR